MLRLSLMLIAVPSAAAADAGHGQPGWTWSPWMVVPLGLSLIVFLVGRARLGSRSKTPRRQSWLFVAGWAVLTLALLSPLHEGGERSFTLHMAEHELIMLIATLLLAASNAGGILAWVSPGRCARRSAGGGKHR